MEIEDNQNKEPERNLFDFGDDKENEGVNKEDDKKKRVIKKERAKMDATFLTDNPIGLKHVYKQMVINKEKTLPLKGKGHEASDLRKVMNIYKNWHF